MSEWTDELKAEVIERYEAAEPTPENSAEIVAEIAEDIDKTPNGVRMILSKAGVYVKKAGSTPSKGGSGSSTSTRVSKADAIASLTEVISANGAEADDEILSKLTGKAAVYFTEVINTVSNND